MIQISGYIDADDPSKGPFLVRVYHAEDHLACEVFENGQMSCRLSDRASMSFFRKLPEFLQLAAPFLDNTSDDWDEVPTEKHARVESPADGE